MDPNPARSLLRPWYIQLLKILQNGQGRQIIPGTIAEIDCQSILSIICDEEIDQVFPLSHPSLQIKIFENIIIGIVNDVFSQMWIID